MGSWLDSSLEDSPVKVVGGRLERNPLFFPSGMIPLIPLKPLPSWRNEEAQHLEQSSRKPVNEAS